MIQENNKLAYFAGYLDGDGCFFIGFENSKKRLKPKRVATIVINSVTLNTLQYFKKIFGGSVQIAKQEHDNKKTLYRYTLKKRNIINFIHKLVPFLCEKKEEALLLVKFIQTSELEAANNLIQEMRIKKDVENLISKHHKNVFEKLRNQINPSETDFAYLAGFIDAECNFGIQKYKPKNKPNYVYKIILQCNNTKAPVFKWLIERFGGQIHFIDRLTHLKSRKNQLTWRLSGKALSKILDNVYPFLQNKKQVCEELIKFYDTTLINGGARHTEEFRESYQEVLRIREEIVSKIHKLNLKGISTLSG